MFAWHPEQMFGLTGVAGSGTYFASGANTRMDAQARWRVLVCIETVVPVALMKLNCGMLLLTIWKQSHFETCVG